jgi:serine/threonine protein phosphatase PrpC
MYPGLSISRSLGDLLSHNIGVSSEPNVRVLELSQHDNFVVIASEGIWSHMSAEDVGEIVSEFAAKDPGISCELVWQKVKEKCHTEGHLLSDTTFIVSQIKVAR